MPNTDEQDTVLISTGSNAGDDVYHLHRCAVLVDSPEIDTRQRDDLPASTTLCHVCESDVAPTRGLAKVLETVDPQAVTGGDGQ